MDGIKFQFLKRGATQNRAFSSKQPSVQRTWQWGLNPNKSQNVWVAITAPGIAPLVEPPPGKTLSRPPKHNDSVPKGVNDRRGNNVEGFWGCWRQNDDGEPFLGPPRTPIRQTRPLAFGGRKDRSDDACKKRPEDIHDRTPHIEPGRNRYVEPHSPDSGRSRTADREDIRSQPAVNSWRESDSPEICCFFYVRILSPSLIL